MILLSLLLCAVLGGAGEPAPANPDDGAAWVELARSLAAKNDHADAIAAWRRAAELGAVSTADAEVEIAAIHAAAGRRDDAIAALEAALAAGYRLRPRLAKDPRFQALASAPRWKKVAGTETSAPAGSAAAWRADLAYLEAEVRRLHPRYRTGPLPPEFVRIRRDLDRRIGTLAAPRVVVEMQRLLATLGDGHTLVWPFGMKTGELKRLPITLWWFDDGFFIVGAPDRDLVGARVVRIGSLTPEEAVKRIEPWVSRDNSMQLRWNAPVYLILADFLQAIGAMSTRESVDFEISPAVGDAGTITLRAQPVDPEKLETRLPSAGAPPYLQTAAQPFLSRRLSDHVLYVQLNAVADAPKKSIAQFAKELRADLEKTPATHLILDLRNNNGGDAGLADEMLRTLIAYDADGGRIWVLIGRVTFSAAETLAARLDQWTSATFVGEPTGSRPNHFGNEAQFVLPHSGVRGTISSGWNQPVTGRDERVWIAPEIPVRTEALDYFAGRDPVLDRILSEIAARK